MKPKPLTLAFFAVAAVVLTGQQAQAQEMPEPQTVSAQVVDMACYLNAGLKGADHKMCAEVCAKAGVPLVFLGDDGNIYLPSGMGMPSAGQNETLTEYAEQKVKVTGVVMERSGSRSIIIDKIEAAGY